MGSIDNEKLKFLLVEPGLIPLNEFKDIVEKAAQQKKAVTELIIKRGFITDEQLGRLIADDLGHKFVDIPKEQIDDDIFFTIPEIMAKTQGVIGIRRLKAGIKVALADPANIDLVHILEKRFNEPVIPYYATQKGIMVALEKYKANMKDAFTSIIGQLEKGNVSAIGGNQIIKTVELLLKYGYKNKASDIHINPYRKKLLVRFRIDGVLHDVLTVHKSLTEPIISRIKILSKMRTDEHRAAQDGKLRFKTDDGVSVGVRVSVVPTTSGENIVMRILSAQNKKFTLKDLGLDAEDFTTVKQAIKHPHGMILVTGPTGSGKTTSLYAVMQILNRREVNIATIEDPVEYDIEGITQIQVNKKTELTFAKGLRALVRQDPDIIMVGEIRDEETAKIAVNSALTGHLVLSTLHTNDAATALPRLLDMGIEPFLVASTVNVVIAQRLVRKNCAACVASYTPDEKEQALIKRHSGIVKILEQAGKEISSLRLYKGQGCKVCGNTGYIGRIGVFEVLEITDTIRQLVINHTHADQIKEQAIKDGMTTMLTDGVNKVLHGQTTFKEVLRVTME